MSVGTRMDILDPLVACDGTWRGTNVLQDPHSGGADESASAAIVTPVLARRFVRIDYTWAYGGKPQEGSLLIGADRKKGVVTTHWIDTWHMSNAVMACTGPASGDSAFSVRGSYSAPTGPDWGWRIAITCQGETLRIVMFNIWPDGDREDLAMETTLSRTQRT